MQAAGCVEETQQAACEDVQQNMCETQQVTCEEVQQNMCETHQEVSEDMQGGAEA